jgi:hypothetical protein
MNVDFVLTGKMPLLMHADDVEAADSLGEWRKAPEHKNISQAGDDRSPAWTWQTYLYRDEENVVIPSHNLMVNLRYAGAQIIMKKQKTFKEVSQSGMLVTSEFLDFTYADGRHLSMTDILGMRDDPFPVQAEACRDLGFRLFVKRAAVGQKKHVRVRPRFDTWQVTGTLQVNAPELTYEVVQKLFELGGNGGLGDWRPNCKTPGCYGMFSAEIKKVR